MNILFEKNSLTSQDTTTSFLTTVEEKNLSFLILHQEILTISEFLQSPVDRQL